MIVQQTRDEIPGAKAYEAFGVTGLTLHLPDFEGGRLAPRSLIRESSGFRNHSPEVS